MNADELFAALWEAILGRLSDDYAKFSASVCSKFNCGRKFVGKRKLGHGEFNKKQFLKDLRTDCGGLVYYLPCLLLHPRFG